MIALYVIAGIVLLVLLLINIDVNLVFDLNDDFRCYARYLFFRYDLKGLFDREGKEEEKKKKKKGRKPTISQRIDYITSLISKIAEQVEKYLRLKICNIDIRIATDDASSTALVYGVVSSSTYMLIETLDNLMTVKKNYKKIRVEPDFTADTSVVKIKIVLKIKPIHALFAAMNLLPYFTNKRSKKK